MLLQNLEQVNNLVNQLERIDKAIMESTETMIKMTDSDKDYWGNISQHLDGSGWQVNLNGCYVANELLESTIEVLKCRRDEVVQLLKDLGVQDLNESIEQ